MMLFVVSCCWLYLLVPVVVVQGSCPVLYGGVDPPTVTADGLRLYLDLNDEELSSVPSALRSFGNPDGTIDIIMNGELQGVFGVKELVLLAPPIPSSVRVIPVHMEAPNEVYYSLSIISSDSDAKVLGPFSGISPNAEAILPGIVKDVDINFCCKDNGTVLLQGCLTISNEPLDLLNGNYLTVGPFFAQYQCEVPKIAECPLSFEVAVPKVELCFTREQTLDLLNSNEGGWSQIGISSQRICAISIGDGGLNLIVTNEMSSSNLPVGPTFSTLDYFFSRVEDIYNWTSPTYYSMSFSPRNTTVLGSINTSIPLEGTFDENRYDFILFLPCLSNGGTFVDSQFNMSGLIDNFVVNNTYHILFYKICLPDNDTSTSSASNVIALSVVLPATIIPTVTILVAVMVTLSVLAIYGAKQRKQVQLLEQLATNIDRSCNTYAFASVYNPFDFLEDENLEYNYAAIEVVGKLGEGFFGTVYKAKAPGLSRGEHAAGEFVAVKTLKDNLDHSNLSEFAKELKVCMQFDHPNVIRLLGVCTESIEKCMIFEFMDLGSLDHCLRVSDPGGKDFDPDGFLLSKMDFLPITLQLAKALDYLSSLNFIHRDIAARNCLINTKLTAKIADFGLSRNLNAQNYYRVGGGKKSYLPIRWMPPEAILYGKFTIKSDVWSFGILMWEIYTFGQLPYTGLSNHEVIDFIKERRVMSQPEDCPIGVYDIIRSTWTIVPSQRPVMSTVVHRLQLFVDGKIDEMRNYVNLNPTNC